MAMPRTMQREGQGGRRRSWPQLLAVAAIALAHGCYAPQLVEPGLFLCPDQKCPEGFSCNAQQRCERVAVDGGADQGGGGRRDGGDGGGGRAALACNAEDPVVVTAANESVIGTVALVSDEGGALALSYPAAVFEGTSEKVRQLVVARRPAPPSTAAWVRSSPEALGGVSAGALLYFTAIDTREGQLAVAFNQRASATAPPSPLSLWVGPASGGSGRVTDLTSVWTGGPLFTGVSPAVALVKAGNNALYALVAGQARPEATSPSLGSALAVIDSASQTRKALLQLAPPSLGGTSDQQVLNSGLAQRLLVTSAPTSRQVFVAQLGELVPRVLPMPASTPLPSTLLFVSQVDLDRALSGQAGVTPSVAWSTETQLSVRAFGTVPLVIGPSGPGVAFAQRGAAAGLFAQSLPPQATLQAIRPGDKAATTAIRPAAASRDGFTGVAYVTYEGDTFRTDADAAATMFGQVCFTANTKARSAEWTRALCLPGTAGESGAYQVEVVASQVTAQRAVFELVYWQRQPLGGTLARLRISHSRVVCTSQL